MKIYTKLFACLTFLFAFSVLANAQETSTEWMRLQSVNNEFSIEIPKNVSYFYDEDGFLLGKTGGQDYQYSQMQMLNAASEKTAMSIEIYKVTSPKNHLNLLIENAHVNTSKLDAPKDFFVKQYEKTSVRDYANDKDVEISFISRYIASKTHIYVITAANRGKRSEAFERFFSSIRLGENQADAVNISSLKPLKIENINQDVTVQNAPLPQQTTDIDKIAEMKKNPTPVLIIMKPKASYTSAARKSLTTGNIRLRASFAENGSVSKIAILSTLPDGLNRSAFFSALRIKFIPNEKEGEFDTVTKIIEYGFSIY